VPRFGLVRRFSSKIGHIFRFVAKLFRCLNFLVVAFEISLKRRRCFVVGNHFSAEWLFHRRSEFFRDLCVDHSIVHPHLSYIADLSKPVAKRWISVVVSVSHIVIVSLAKLSVSFVVAVRLRQNFFHELPADQDKLAVRAIEKARI
jgi:hypothetical protein